MTVPVSYPGVYVQEVRSGGRLAQLGDELLADRPFLKILALDSNGRRSFLYQLEPHLQALGEVLLELLIQTVRAATVLLSERKTKET